MESEQSHWEETLNYETQYLSPEDCLKLMYVLRAQNIRQPDVSFYFKSFSHYTKFKRAYDDQTEADGLGGLASRKEEQLAKTRGRMHEAILKREKEKGGPSQELKEKLSIDLESFNKAVFFQDIYEKKLTEMEQEYGYMITNAGKFLKVHTPTLNLSPMFKNEIWDMKNSLEMYYSFQPCYWQNLRYSKLLLERLEDKGVYFVIRNSIGDLHNYTAFYSIKLKYEEIKKTVFETLAEDLTVIKLFDKETGRYLTQNEKIFFDLILDATQGMLEGIKKRYEIQMENNRHYGCLILHTRHKAFADLPTREIQELFSGLCLIRFTLAKRKWLNSMQRLSKTANGNHFRVVGDRRAIYFCIDQKKLKILSQLTDLIGDFLDTLSDRSRIWVYVPRAIEEAEAERIENLAKDYSLEVMDYFTKNLINLRLIDFADSAKVKLRKQNHVLNFFLKVVIRGFPEEIPLECMGQIIRDDKKGKDNYIEKPKPKGFLMENKDESNTEEVSHENANENDGDKSKLLEKKGYAITFSPVKYSAQVSVEVVLKTGQREKKIRQELQDLSDGNKFQVYGLIFASNFEERKQFPNEAELTSKEAFLVKRIYETEGNLKKLSPLSELEFSRLSTFEKDDQGFILYLDEGTERYVASYSFKRVE